MKILIIILMILVLSSLMIISNNNLNILKEDDAMKFSEIYFEWLDNTYSNLQNITGHVIESNWFPE